MPGEVDYRGPDDDFIDPAKEYINDVLEKIDESLEYWAKQIENDILCEFAKGAHHALRMLRRDIEEIQ